MTVRPLMKALLVGALFASSLSPLASRPAFAAEPVAKEPIAKEVVKADTLDQLRSFSISLWPRFRDTSQQYYTYIRAAADMRAYFHTCTRNDLTPHMSTVNQLAVRYMQTIITAHYEENEWATFDGMTPARKAEVLTDFASDVYAFEYGLSLAAFEARQAASGKTPLHYCQGIAREYQTNYIALLATARRELDGSR